MLTGSPCPAGKSLPQTEEEEQRRQAHRPGRERGGADGRRLRVSHRLPRIPIRRQ